MLAKRPNSSHAFLPQANGPILFIVAAISPLLAAIAEARIGLEGRGPGCYLATHPPRSDADRAGDSCRGDCRPRPKKSEFLCGKTPASIFKLDSQREGTPRCVCPIFQQTVLWLVLAPALVALGWLFGSRQFGQPNWLSPASKNPADRIEAPADHLAVSPVTYRSVKQTVEAAGTLQGSEEISICSTAEGRVVELAHDVADRLRPRRRAAAGRSDRLPNWPRGRRKRLCSSSLGEIGAANLRRAQIST